MYFPPSIGPGELMALGSSVSYSVTLVAIRQGLRAGTPLAAVLTVLGIVSAGGLCTSLFRGTLQTSTLTPLLWFAAIGVIGPGIGNISDFIGIQRLGVSRSTLVQSSSPIWGTLLAVFTLGERPRALVVLGTLCIVGGVSLFAFWRENHKFGSGFHGALIFPLIASVAYGLVPVFSKFAYAHQKTPMAGLGVAFAVGILVLLAAKPLLPGGGKVHASRQDILWFTLAGAFNLISSSLLWTAFMVGDVSSVLPVSRLYPLWVVLLSYLFLGRLERVTWRIVLAAALVVAGGVLVTAFAG